MPKNKDLKRLVRSRMEKTGEAYTTARSRLVDKSSPLPDDYEQLAEMKDESVHAKTGRTWPEWAAVLDEIDAASMQHREIAKYLHDHFEEVSPWWAQTVTVGYERIRGLRDIGQRRGGRYQISKSKTVAAPLAALYEAWSDGRTRTRWLDHPDLTIRTANEDKSMRIVWGDGTAVDVYFTAKGERKSQVAVQHHKLPTREAADEAKLSWAERLAALAELLAASG